MWLLVIIFLFISSHSAAQPSAGNIEISEQTPITTKGIFIDANSTVFCSQENSVDFTIIHQQDFEINCDPDPSTPAGIRYLILIEKPINQHIRDLATLKSLPIHRKDGQIVVLGSGVANNLSIRESQLAHFGLERPFEVWIIPFISHNIGSTTFEGHFESQDQCLDFNLESGVSFTALNKITFLANVERSPLGDLTFQYNEIWGSGGLPELYPLEEYILHAVDNETGDTMKVIRTEDDKNRFKPKTRTGTLFFWVSDSLGCESGGLEGLRFIQPTIQLYSRDDYAYTGDIRCMPVLADNFFDMQSFTITMNWNANELRLTDVSNVHPLLDQGTIAIDSTRAAEGILKFIWQDTTNFKLVPGTILFDLCFDVMANPGTRAEITFDEDGTNFYNGNFNPEWEGEAGTITVGPDTWNVLRYYTYCYSGKDSVDVTFHTLGKYPPYTLEIPEAGISRSGIKGNEITFSDFPTGEYSYRLTDSLGGTHYVRNAINISSGSQPELSLAEAIPPDCGSDDGLIKLNTIESDYQYIHISGPGIDNIYPQKILFEDLTSGTYTISVSDAGGCQSKPLTVELGSSSSLHVLVEQIDDPCDQQPAMSKIVLLDNNQDTVNLVFRLDDNELYASNTFFDLAPGMHTVDISHPDYCDVHTEITIPEDHSAVNSVKLHIPDAGVKKDKPFTVTAEYGDTSGIISYHWSPPSQLLNGSQDKARFVLDTSSWISLEVMDDHGCTFSDSIFINIIKVEAPEEESSWFVPNSFTPNEDGVNEQLKFYTKNSDISVEEVNIFDRYGNLLFTSAGPFTDHVLWNGKAHQQLVPPGVYALQIIIRLDDKTIEQVNQDVTVLR